MTIGTKVKSTIIGYTATYTGVILKVIDADCGLFVVRWDYGDTSFATITSLEAI